PSAGRTATRIVPGPSGVREARQIAPSGAVRYAGSLPPRRSGPSVSATSSSPAGRQVRLAAGPAGATRTSPLGRPTTPAGAGRGKVGALTRERLPPPRAAYPREPGDTSRRSRGARRLTPPAPTSAPSYRPVRLGRTMSQTFASGAETPADQLRSMLDADPARPVVTYYDDATGERVELSVKTLDNWVAKTANLLQDDLAAAPGDRAAILLPAHWQTAIWLLACWSVGVTACPGGDPATAALVVS